jgi:hypothetical protein
VHRAADVDRRGQGERPIDEGVGRILPTHHDEHAERHRRDQHARQQPAVDRQRREYDPDGQQHAERHDRLEAGAREHREHLERGENRPADDGGDEPATADD